jgi:spermidine synthase
MGEQAIDPDWERPPDARVHGTVAERLKPRRAALELFLVSFLILFFELTCIRWFGSIVLFLTFFTNIVLMACFLGVSVGCLAASRRWSLIHGSIPGMLLAVGLAYAVLWCYFAFDTRVMIDVGGQRSPQQIYFGADSRIDDPAAFVVPIEALAGIFFVAIALVFVGLGQVMGRRFDAIPDRLAAYTADILGSLAGIAAFGAASYWQVPATAWFAISLGLALYFTPRLRWLHAAAALGVLSIVAFRVDWPNAPPGTEARNIWSPYNFVSYKPGRHWIDVNNLAHQGMQRIGETGAAYMLPYLLNRDAGGRPFRDVLIIGAGSGNDVSAALRQGAGHVDADEIDPVIAELGRRDHPDHPYQDPRVAVHLDDGRGFLRKTEQRYDLIIYALVDSLALHSSYSSLRLESFLFTAEAFRDVAAKLKPGGVFALYNFYRQGWVVGRLEKLVETVFGSRPVVVSLPYQETITAENHQRGYITFLLAGTPSNPVVEAIRARLEHDRYFWLNPRPMLNQPVNGYGRQPPSPPPASGPPSDPSPPAPEFQKIGAARVDVSRIGRVPTDDWPFLYLRRPWIPALNLRGIAIVGVLSLAILFLFAPVRRIRPNGQMFFLGAGFMLLETKGVVHMALLFGGTWMVNSIVFAAILIMILLANLYVLGLRPRRLWPHYAMLLAALGLNSLVPMADFLVLPGLSRIVLSCAVVFIPVFFAGVIFATAFRASTQPDVDFGSNIGGIILGGLSESLSLVLGFSHLLWVAIGYYVLSALLVPSRQSPGCGSAVLPQ